METTAPENPENPAPEAPPENPAPPVPEEKPAPRGAAKAKGNDWKANGWKAPRGRPKKSPVSAHAENPPAVEGDILPAVGDPVAATAAATVDRIKANLAEKERHAKRGAEALGPAAIVDPGPDPEAEPEAAAEPEPAAPQGVPADDVMPLIVESADNLLHAISPDYCMTPRERSTMAKSYALGAQGRMVPWFLAAVVSTGCFLLRIFVMWKLRSMKATREAEAKKAPPPAPAAAEPPPPASSSPASMAAALGGGL